MPSVKILLKPLPYHHVLPVLLSFFGLHSIWFPLDVECTLIPKYLNFDSTAKMTVFQKLKSLLTYPMTKVSRVTRFFWFVNLSDCANFACCNINTLVLTRFFVSHGKTV